MNSVTWLVQLMAIVERMLVAGDDYPSLMTLSVLKEWRETLPEGLKQVDLGAVCWEFRKWDEANGHPYRVIVVERGTEHYWTTTHAAFSTTYEDRTHAWCMCAQDAFLACLTADMRVRSK